MRSRLSRPATVGVDDGVKKGRKKKINKREMQKLFLYHGSMKIIEWLSRLATAGVNYDICNNYVNLHHYPTKIEISETLYKVMPYWAGY